MEANSAVEHNSRMLCYRAPLGAVAEGTEVVLRIYAPLAFSATLCLWDGAERFLPMEKQRDGFFSVKILCGKSGLVCYYFAMRGTDEMYYLNNKEMLGGVGECTPERDAMRTYGITVYSADFKTPQWCAGAVMYQIFPDRFASAGAGKTEGRKLHASWIEDPEYQPDPAKGYYAADDFFGGDLKGIESKLNYLKAMGVSVIYLNPIFKAYSNHRYDTGDYELIDELLGTNDDFAHMCKHAQELGMRVILDGVFSHTGSDSKYFNRERGYETVGAYNSRLSVYYPWYSFKDYPDQYDCWWGVWSLPCTNETEPSFMDYILSGKDAVVKRWLRAGASGWRLDVADELPDEFLFEMRRQVKAENSDALIIGEVWEDASRKVSYGALRPYLQGMQLDSVMNYPLRSALLDYLMHGDAVLFCRRVESLRENYPPMVFNCLMNFVSTHDTVRACTYLGGAPELSRDRQACFKLCPQREMLAISRLELAYAILFLLPGMPMVYYGDEDYAQGYADPFNRTVKRWGKIGMQELLASLAGIHARASEYGLELIPCGSALCIARGGYMGVFNPADAPLEQILDKSLIISGSVELTNGACELKLREHGMYLLLEPMSFCIIKKET